MIAEDDDFLRPIVRTVIQEFLKHEMTQSDQVTKGERVEGRSSYRSGYYPRSLITRVGKLELRSSSGPQRTVFHRESSAISAAEKALVAALAEMYIQGVSTRKVKAMSKDCGRGLARVDRWTG